MRVYTHIYTLSFVLCFFKATDASLLCVAGFPAFAIPSAEIRDTVTKNVIDVLEVSLNPST